MPGACHGAAAPRRRAGIPLRSRVDASHRGVAPHLGAAGEDHALRTLLGRKQVLGVLELNHLAREQLALAGAAIARLAGEGERHPGAQQRGEDGVARRDRYRPLVTLEGDLHALARKATMLAVSGQIVWKPNKIAS